MEQKLFTELRSLYTTRRENPDGLRVRMRDLTASDVPRRPMNAAMKRYPHFCVELQKKEGQHILAENPGEIESDLVSHRRWIRIDRKHIGQLRYGWTARIICAIISMLYNHTHS